MSLKFHEIWWKKDKHFKTRHFCVPMEMASTYLQLILICFAQLIPPILDIIPVKFHEFLFSSYTILIKIVFVFYHLIGYHDNGSHFDNYKN